jgi:hypothetical protein
MADALETEEEIKIIEQQLNTLENASVVVHSPPSHSSSIKGVRYELSEMNDRLQDFEEPTTRQLENIEGLVTILKGEVKEVHSKVNDNGICLSRSMDQLERSIDRRLCDLKKDVGERFDKVKEKTNKRFDDVDQRLTDVDQRFRAKIDVVDYKLENF